MRPPAGWLAGLVAVASLVSCRAGTDTAADSTTAVTPAVTAASTATSPSTTSPVPVTPASPTTQADPADLALFTELGQVNPVFLDDYRADPATALAMATAEADAICKIARDSVTSKPTEQWATGVYIHYIGLPKKTRDLYGAVEGYGVAARALLAWGCPDQAGRLLGP